ncbi:MAG: PAS domain S-box protein [Rhodospirillaceae bacterium]|nr:PAS domain S-box protein [Rhodospirillaceae bacterium]
MPSRKKPVIQKTKAPEKPGKALKMPKRPAGSPASKKNAPQSGPPIGDWIWEANNKNEIIFVSDRFDKSTGIDPKNIIGKTFQEISTADKKYKSTNDFLFGAGKPAAFNQLPCARKDTDDNDFRFVLFGVPIFDDKNKFSGYRGNAQNITESLKEVDIQSSGLFAHSPHDHNDTSANKEAFVIYDKKGKVIGASEEYLEMYPEIREMIAHGTDLKDILTETATRMGTFQDSNDATNWVKEKLQERLSPKGEAKEIYRNGKWWRINEHLTDNGDILCLHTNITRQKEMETSLLDAETRYRKLVELAPDLTCVITDGIITLINSAGAKILGCDTVDELLGQYFYQYVHNDFRDIIQNELQALLDETWMPIRLVRNDGTVIDAELAAMPMTNKSINTVMLVARDTSDRKRAVEALITRDDHLRGIMDTVIDGIITIDPLGIVQSFNKSAERIFGFMAYEVIGKNIKILMPEPYQSEHDGYLSKYSKSGKKNIIGMGREVIGKRKNGETFPMDLAVSELKRDKKTFFIGVVRDITAKKQVEENLLESQERLALAIAGSGEGIWDWNAKTSEVYISEKIRSMLGIKAERIKYKEWIGHVITEDQELYKRSLVAHLKGDTPSFNIECRVMSKNKKIFWISINGLGLRDDNGWVYRMSGSIGDITARIESEREIIAAKERAEIASRVKTEFLANMSHELRTPLNAIIGFSDVMISEIFGKLDKRYAEYVENISDSGKHLLGVINDILDVSRIETGNMEIEPERVKVADLINIAVRLINDRARTGGLKIIKQLDRKIPDVNVDSQRMKQAVINILSNAVKFTPEGGKITISTAQTANGSVQIIIADTGIGMKKEDIKTALLPFGQVDSRLARKYEGTGLGLPLTKSFIEMHAGKLAISSKPEAGTRVTITIPAKRVIK